MNKHFILIRHATPEVVSSIPSSQWKLTKVGRKRAHLLAKRLRLFPVEVVVASPEPKALETAEILASYYNLVPSTHTQLHEHYRAQMPFMTESDFKKSMLRLFANPGELTFGSETAFEAGARFEKSVSELLVNFPNKGLAIVSHGTVTALYVANKLNQDPYQIWRDMTMPMAYVFSRPELVFLSKIQVPDNEI